VTSPNDYVARSEARDYDGLFRMRLNWNAPHLPPIQVLSQTGETLTATNVSSYRGISVWEVPRRPGSAMEAEVERRIVQAATNRLVIFHEGDEQVWRWPSRTSTGAAITTRPARHRHRSGSADRRFAERLDAIHLPVDIELDVNQVLTRLREAFDLESRQESRRASKLMVRLYEAVEKGYPEGYDPVARDHQISVTLARILFLLFGDDTEMWLDADEQPQPELFQDFVRDHTAADGSNICAWITELFRVLDRPETDRNGVPAELATFPHVNGDIFDEPVELPQLGAEFRDALLDASAVDWTLISPAIFGSMFQSVRDAETRRELGEHYTSETNILRTLRPLFLDELEAELQEALARDTSTKRRNALNKLWTRLGEIRFLDPACGCGNFIIVAYRELRDLELRVVVALVDEAEGTGAATLGGDWTSTLKVTLDHFHGIEIDEWPAAIARTAMFLVDRQCDLRLQERLGDPIRRLPIKREATIRVANALRLDWATVCPPGDSVVVAGNPPFLGHATRSPAQAQDLRDVWGTDDISRLDYVTGWHAKTLDYLGSHDARWAFVTTNSVTQGDPVPHLFGPIFQRGWRIRFGHRTFPWTSDAAGKAAVHCVIVGFDRRPKTPARLFDYGPDGELLAHTEAPVVNAYLVDGPSVFVLKRTLPLSDGLPVATFGNMPRDDGNLIVPPTERRAIMKDPIAKKYLRPFVGAEELLRGLERWCLWLTDAPGTDLRGSPELRARLRRVKKFREASTASSTRAMAATPQLFGQRPALHSKPYVIIPRVSSERRPYLPVKHVPPRVIASDATFTASDPKGFLFALISSSMFLAWQKAVGGRLKSDIRFSSTIVWNNLPLPPIDADLRQRVIDAGQAVIAARDLRPDLTLAQHYAPGQLSAALQAAHDALDVVVDQAFGAPHTCVSEEERQAVLFQRYAELTAG